MKGPPYSVIHISDTQNETNEGNLDKLLIDFVKYLTLLRNNTPD